MTESDWRAQADPHAMLDFLRESGRVTDRKLRLFACACCRRIWPLLSDPRSRSAVEVAEAFADGEATGQALEDAWTLARQAEEDAQTSEEAGPGEEGHRGANSYAACAAAYAASDLQGLRTAAGYAQGAVYWSAVLDVEERAAERSIFAFLRTSYTSFVPPAARVDAREAERGEQARLLRDLFGNPFVPRPGVDAAWLTWGSGTVFRLVEATYQERELPSGTLDPLRLTVLADALEEAGCPEPDLLDHLRGPGRHFRGCWVLDLPAGKSMRCREGRGRRGILIGNKNTPLGVETQRGATLNSEHRESGWGCGHDGAAS